MTQTFTSKDNIPDHQEFLQDVIAGLSAPQKTLPYKYFYDEKGSQLFDQICELEEYYLTRTEQHILQERGAEMGEWIGPHALLFEPGAGSSVKVETLFPHLHTPTAYVPVDISREHLLVSTERLQKRFPHIPIVPVVADYSSPFSTPSLEQTPNRIVVFYPGSTIGNFPPEEAVSFLKRLSNFVGPGGGLLIGFDVKKDKARLEAAYNDKKGVTAAFHMNLLERINRELHANIELTQFAHHAPFNEDKSRIEMHLVSRCPQKVSIAGHTFSFEEGETIFTECSYKHTPEKLAAIAEKAGFAREVFWTDQEELFGVMALSIPNE